MEDTTQSSNSSARRHQRTREQHAAEVTEDYLEAIGDLEEDRGEARVTDLAKRLGVSHVTVIQTVKRLKDQELVETEPYKAITLTRSGREVADASRERHVLVTEFLVAIGVSREVADSDAEGIEHHVSRETLRAMERFLDA